MQACAKQASKMHLVLGIQKQLLTYSLRLPSVPETQKFLGRIKILCKRRGDTRPRGPFESPEETNFREGIANIKKLWGKCIELPGNYWIYNLIRAVC